MLQRTHVRCCSVRMVPAAVTALLSWRAASHDNLSVAWLAGLRWTGSRRSGRFMFCQVLSRQCLPPGQTPKAMRASKFIFGRLSVSLPKARLCFFSYFCSRPREIVKSEEAELEVTKAHQGFVVPRRLQTKGLLFGSPPASKWN